MKEDIFTMNTDNIKVVINVRPRIAREIQTKLKPQWHIQGNNIFNLEDPSQGYSFDHVFNESQNNSVVYETSVKPLVLCSLKGVNSTIFAYGQTSSGKTYTMFGIHEDSGIVLRALDDIFKHIKEDDERDYLVRCSYLEIYNEKINDLLNKNTKVSQDIKIRETSDGGPRADVKEEVIDEPLQAMILMQRGSKIRKQACTDMNERSSRSHTIFKIIIHSQPKKKEDAGLAMEAELNLVDLAGSERVGQTKATGSVKKEGVHINMSLHNLRLVMRKLSEGCSFVGFRDSKLTRLLQNALGGNNKTLVIATVTLVAAEETKSTLEFAQIARTVQNKPVVNVKANLSEDKEELNKLAASYVEKIEVVQSEKLKLERVIEEYNNKLKHLNSFVSLKQERMDHEKSRTQQRRHTFHASSTRFLPTKLMTEKIPEEEEEKDGSLVTKPSMCSLESTKEEILSEVLYDFTNFFEKVDEETQTNFGEVSTYIYGDETLQIRSSTPEVTEFIEFPKDTPSPITRQLEDLERSYRSLKYYTQMEKNMTPSELEMFHELKQKMEELQQNCIDTNVLYTNANKKVNSLTQRLKNCQDEVTQLTQRNEELETAQNCFKTRIQQINNDNAFLLEQKDKNYNDKIRLLEQELEKLRLSNRAGKTVSDLENFLLEKESQITAQNKLITEIDETNFDLIHKLDDEKRKNEELSSCLENLKCEQGVILSEKVEVKNEVRKLQKICEELKKTIRKLRKKYIHTNRCNLLLKKRNYYFKKRIRSLIALKCDYLLAIEQLEERLEHLTKGTRCYIETLEGQVAAKNAIILKFTCQAAITWKLIVQSKIAHEKQDLSEKIGLNTKILSLETEIQRLEGLIQKAEIKSQQLQNEIENTTDLCNLQQNEKEDLSNKMYSLEAEKLKVEELLKKVELKYQQKQKDYTDMNSKVCLLESEKEKLGGLLREAQDKCQQTQQDCKMAKELNSKLRLLENDKLKLKSALEKAEANFQHSIQNEMKLTENMCNLQKSYDDLNKKISCLESENAELNCKYYKLQQKSYAGFDEIATLTDRVNILEADKLKLEDLLEKANGREKEYAESIIKLQKNLKDSNMKTENMTTSIVLLEDKKIKVEEVLKKTEEKYQQTQNDLNSKISLLESETLKLKESLEKSEIKYQQAAQSEKDCVENLCKLQKDNDNLRSSLNNYLMMQQGISNLETRNSTLVQYLEESKIKIEHLEQQKEKTVKNLKDRIAKQEAIIRKLQDTNDLLHEINDDLKTKQNADSDAIRHLNNNLDSLADQVDTLTRKNATLMSDLELEQIRYENAIAKFKEKFEQTLDETKQLKQINDHNIATLSSWCEQLNTAMAVYNFEIKRNPQFSGESHRRITREFNKLQEQMTGTPHQWTPLTDLIHSESLPSSSTPKSPCMDPKATDSPREIAKRKRHSTHDSNRPSLEDVTDCEMCQMYLEEIETLRATCENVVSECKILTSECKTYKRHILKLKTEHDIEVDELCSTIQIRDNVIQKLKEEYNNLIEERKSFKRPTATASKALKTTKIYDLEKQVEKYRKEKDNLQREVQALRDFRGSVPTKKQETQTKDQTTQVKFPDEEIEQLKEKYQQYKMVAIRRRQEILHLKEKFGIDPDKQIGPKSDH